MINVQQATGTEALTNEVEVIGDTITELVDEMSKRIRRSSWPFYETEIRRELAESGSSFVDCHAGGGTHYTARLRADT